MGTTFKNGQVIFGKKLDNCDHNDYGIFCIMEDEITKVVFKKKILLENRSYCLRSLNPNYKDIADSMKKKFVAVLPKNFFFKQFNNVITLTIIYII